MNKIVQPVTRGFYWVILALLAVGTLVSLIAVPASARLMGDDNGYDSWVPVTANTTSGENTGIHFTGGWNSSVVYQCHSSLPFDPYPSGVADTPEHVCGWQDGSGFPVQLNWTPACAGGGYAGNASLTYVDVGEWEAGITVDCPGGNCIIPHIRWICGETIVDPNAPVCSFTATPTSGIVPLLVSFTSTSTGAASAYWEVLDNSTGLPVLATSGLVFQNYIVGANKQYDINYSATNAYGNCVLFAPQHITTYGVSGVTTWVQAVDGLTSGAIHGSDIQIKDVETGIWVNVTNDQDGTSSITTNTTATIDAYAQATGYTSTSRLGLTPGDLVYELIMWPSTAFLDPGIGNVNLAIIVNDKLTASPIQGASVTVTVPSGATIGGSTNAAGTEIFQVPNMSVIHVTVKETGYTTASTTITTSAFGPDTKRIELVKATVTPTITATPLPGEATVRPTLDTRTGNQKDADMMEQIRDSGPMLIQLAILATIVGLGKLMIK